MAPGEVDGAEGELGVDGVLGVEGELGVDGVLGVEGVEGVLGAPGSEGVDGSDGVPGSEGVEPEEVQPIVPAVSRPSMRRWSRERFISKILGQVTGVNQIPGSLWVSGPVFCQESMQSRFQSPSPGLAANPGSDLWRHVLPRGHHAWPRGRVVV